MIPLVLPARSDAPGRFVTRLVAGHESGPYDSRLISSVDEHVLFAGSQGMFSIETAHGLIGDVVCVDPKRGSAERLIRANSTHNTLLITEQCDQLCVMCSQPPKKQHVDRFDEYRRAMLLAPEGAVIGLSGGEPTLHKEALFGFLEDARTHRPDLFFHILSNGQHFEAGDVPAIRECRANTLWGIPLYSHTAEAHDAIVAKPGAFERLMDSFVHCLSGGMSIELRTVILRSNYGDLPSLARAIVEGLPFVSQWSIMQLENIGFARNRFDELYVDHGADFRPLAEALDVATLFGVPCALFNFPRCSVPSAYRDYVANSISDWKRSYPAPCFDCGERDSCSGFFAWHPEAKMRVQPI